ncbi:MAG: ParB/RepB/Spo0J family partition protein [Opitutales bacterium]
MASPKKKHLGRGLGGLISGGVSNKEAHAKKAPAPVKKTAAPSRPARKAPARKKTGGASAGTSKPAAARGQAKEAADLLEGYTEIAVSQVDPNPFQPRRDIAPEQVEELARSIRAEGLLQPIVVRKVGERYQLIAGERRLRAFESLGIKRIPARQIEASDASSAALALIENLQREGLNPIEEALGYASLMKDFGLTQESCAERVGKGRASVANALRLLSLEAGIQAFLAKGLISTGHAKVILGLQDPAHRQLLAERIIESGMSVREAEREVKRLKDGSGGGSKQSNRSLPPAENAVIRDLEKRLMASLNTKVQLKHTPKKGRIVIDYSGNDDLQRILDQMGIPVT